MEKEDFEELCGKLTADVAQHCNDYRLHKEILRKAMQGDVHTVNRLIQKVHDAIENTDDEYEGENIVSAVYDRCFGFGQLSVWWSEKYKDTSERMRVSNGSAIISVDGHDHIETTNIDESVYKRIDMMFDGTGYFAFEDGSTIERYDFGEYEFNRIVAVKKDTNEMLINILDTLMDNTYEHFNAKAVEDWKFIGDSGIDFHLVNGQTVHLTVSVE